MVKKNTNWVGEKNYRAKLSAEHVREIRALLGTESQADVARRFSLKPSSLSRIASGKTWAHLQ